MRADLRIRLCSDLCDELYSGAPCQKSEDPLFPFRAAANACGKFENKVAVSSDTFDYDKSNNQDGTSVFVSENTTEKIENPVNDTYLLVLAKNSLQKSMVSKLENLTHPQSLTTIELPKTGLPIVLLLLVSMISIGFLPIKISKKR